jgi:hypothetical protein
MDHKEMYDRVHKCRVKARKTKSKAPLVRMAIDLLKYHNCSDEVIAREKAEYKAFGVREMEREVFKLFAPPHICACGSPAKMTIKTLCHVERDDEVICDWPTLGVEDRFLCDSCYNDEYDTIKRLRADDTELTTQGANNDA